VVAAAKLHTVALIRATARLEPWLLRRERRSEAQFTLGDPERAPSRATQFVLARAAGDSIVEHRRAGYRRLLSEFSALVPAPFATLPDGVCPLVFPVETPADPGFEERLLRRGISVRMLWPRPHPALRQDEFPQANAWRHRFVPLPVHQELRGRDIERVATAIRSVLSQSPSAARAAR
jgi:hypothetical protein